VDETQIFYSNSATDIISETTFQYSEGLLPPWKYLLAKSIALPLSLGKMQRSGSAKVRQCRGQEMQRSGNAEVGQCIGQALQRSGNAVVRQCKGQAMQR
jgi:hypothetical protein